MRRDPTYCASCTEYPLPQAAESGGKAYCEWFGERGWDYPACVLHNRAKDYEQRKSIVIKLMEQQKKGTA